MIRSISGTQGDAQNSYGQGSDLNQNRKTILEYLNHYKIQLKRPISRELQYNHETKRNGFYVSITSMDLALKDNKFERMFIKCAEFVASDPLRGYITNNALLIGISPGTDSRELTLTTLLMQQFQLALGEGFNISDIKIDKLDRQETKQARIDCKTSQRKAALLEKRFFYITGDGIRIVDLDMFTYKKLKEEEINRTLQTTGLGSYL